ncbi:MAG: hypothetical protein COV91_04450 [Candidatus Taylorbacteria bacterium CG11_big_fil_rev_8_21_14_0_20_46_11]|uniref:Methyltransferase small domain-containing protein n=1 Tax=Candidatus Taylorbacteria bacterium CG11_big_fil_rev_8_21_14_0_20_46_11 TaxID=1975025 RepID=A0A2H0KAV5_9BACT|nr:MAG: hypothetical protein COV91_04450 [Candidatus Taylorbacteria bacterium CG11_big_fil_rev_8_21_14_0_20_46_11]
MKTPNMFDTEVQFEGITLNVDPINRSRTDQDDNVMAIFWEEQPFMWHFSKGYIDHALKKSSGEVEFLDVGTGSGIWSILVKKHLTPKSVIALDINKRAISQAKKNAIRNKVSFDVRNEYYGMHSVAYRSAKVIGIYPPYHIYPAEVENKIPLHARGGIDGQQLFKEQLTTANYHLAEEGVIVFNMMCLGRNGKPEFARYIPRIVEQSSLKYTNIFPPTRTREFLLAVYGEEFSQFQKGLSKSFPELYFCDGVITRDGKGKIEEIPHKIPLYGRRWKDRIQLHKEVAKHGKDGK